MACILMVSAFLALDLSIPSDNYEAFLRTRYSIDGSEVLFHWTGDIYSYVPGEQSIQLFIGEGFNVARLEPVEGGYRMLSREIFVYRDPGSGEILSSWVNPLTSDTLDVIHVANDPVNAVLPRSQGDWQFQMPYTILSDGTVAWDLDILLCYPSPLPADSFPEFSGSNTYQGAEMFQFLTPLSTLEDTLTPSVPCDISWTRIGPWLPWMRMGSASGVLIYHCIGEKLAAGWDGLPADLRSWVEENQPGFRHAPETYTRPNETSWTYFRRMLEEGEVEP